MTESEGSTARGDGSTCVLNNDLRGILMSGQPLGTIHLDFAICRRCKHVYKLLTGADDNCPKCKGAVGTAELFAPVTVWSLVNLIQDFFRVELSRTTVTGERVVEEKEPCHHVGIILMFCTLVECWMRHFLRSLMESRQIPEHVNDRKSRSNWRHSDRLELFKELTGKTFDDVLMRLTDGNKRKGRDLDYTQVWRFCRDVVDTRNRVIHEGAIRGFSESLVEECICNIHGVNQLFISLHNEFIAQSVSTENS